MKKSGLGQLGHNEVVGHCAGPALEGRAHAGNGLNLQLLVLVGVLVALRAGWLGAFARCTLDRAALLPAALGAASLVELHLFVGGELSHGAGRASSGSGQGACLSSWPCWASSCLS